jgi:hypothetical protein
MFNVARDRIGPDDPSVLGPQWRSAHTQRMVPATNTPAPLFSTWYEASA